VVDAARQSVERFDPLAKTAKKQLSKLRLEHGEELMRFVKEALRDLPEKADGGVAVEASSSVLIEACDAARLILWLGAYPSPVPHKACHNVSVRCKALRRLDLAAEMSAFVAESLRAASGGVASKGLCAPPPRMGSADGRLRFCAAVGVETAEELELGVKALSVYGAVALETLQLTASARAAPLPVPVDEPRLLVPTGLTWVRALRRALVPPEDASKENSPAAAAAASAMGAAAKAEAALGYACAALAEVVRAGRRAVAGGEGGTAMGSPEEQAAWERELRALSGAAAAAAVDEAPPATPAPKLAPAAKPATAAQAAAPLTKPVVIAAVPDGPVGAAIKAEVEAYVAALGALAPTASSAATASTPHARGGSVATGASALPATPSRRGAVTLLSAAASEQAARYLGAARAAGATAGAATGRGTQESALNLSECHALEMALRPLYDVYARTLDGGLTLRDRRDAEAEAEGGAGAGGVPGAPVPLLSAMADAMDRLASVLGVLATASGAHERRSRTARCLVQSLYAASKLRLACDGAADDEDCERADVAAGRDWVCGVLRRLGRAAAAVTSDACASDAEWPPSTLAAFTDATEAADAAEPPPPLPLPSAAAAAEAATWLVTLGARTHKCAKRLFGSSQRQRALAFAEAAAAMARHAVALSAAVAHSARLDDAPVTAARGLATPQKPARPPGGAAAAVLTHAPMATAPKSVAGAVAGGTTVGVSSTVAGERLEEALSLQCSASFLVAHCWLPRGESARAEALAEPALVAQVLGAVGKAIESRARLETLNMALNEAGAAKGGEAGCGEAGCASAGRDAHRGATATVAKMAPRTPAAPGTMAPPVTNGRAAAAQPPSLSELISLHASVRAKALTAALAKAKAQVPAEAAASASRHVATTASALGCLVALSTSRMPPALVARVAAWEMAELAARAPAALATAPQLLLTVADEAARMLAAPSLDLERASVAVACAEALLRLPAAGATASAVREAGWEHARRAIALATPLCGALVATPPGGVHTMLHTTLVATLPGGAPAPTAEGAVAAPAAGVPVAGVPAAGVPAAGVPSTAAGVGDGLTASLVMDLKATELRAALEARGLESHGRKAEMAARLTAALEAAEAAATTGVHTIAAAAVLTPSRAPVPETARMTMASMVEMAPPKVEIAISAPTMVEMAPPALARCRALEVLGRAHLACAASVLVLHAPAAAAAAMATSLPADSAGARERAAEARAAEAAAAEMAEAAACAGASTVAVAEATAAMAAWEALAVSAEASEAAAAAVREAIPELEAAVGAALRCGWLLGMALASEPALAAAAVAERLAAVLGMSAHPVHRQRARLLTAMGLGESGRLALRRAAAAEVELAPRRLGTFDDLDEGSPTSVGSLPLAADLAALDLAADATDAADAAAAAAATAAMARLARQLDDLRAASRWAEAASVSLALAHVHRAHGRPSEALAHATSAARLAMRGLNGGRGSGEGGGGSLGVVGSEGGAEVTAAEGLLLASELWAARGSLGDAQRYVSAAARLGRSTHGWPRLRVRSLLTQATLHLEAGRSYEAGASLDAAATAMGLPNSTVATAAIATIATATSTMPSGAELLCLSLDALRAAWHERRGEPSAALAMTRAALHALPALTCQLAATATRERGGASADAAEAKAEAAAAVAPSRAAMLLTAGRAHRALGDLSAALDSLHAARSAAEAMSTAEGAAAAGAAAGAAAEGVVAAGGGAPLAEVWAEIGLTQLQATWQPSVPTAGLPRALPARQPSPAATWQPSPAAARASWRAARIAMSRALYLGRGGGGFGGGSACESLRPATWQRLCVGLAVCCGARHGACAAQLLTASIGAGVGAQMRWVAADAAAAQPTSAASVLATAATNAATSGAGDEDDVEAAMLAEAVGSLSLASATNAATATPAVGSRRSAEDSGATDDAVTKALRAAILVMEAEDEAEDEGEPSSEAAWAEAVAAAGGWEAPADVAASAAEPQLIPRDALSAWMHSPPEGVVVTAVAVGPSGKGLVVSRWRRGADPAFVAVPEPAVEAMDASTGADEAGGGDATCPEARGEVAAVLASLRHLMSRARDSSMALGGAAEGEGHARAASHELPSARAPGGIVAALEAAAAPPPSDPAPQSSVAAAKPGASAAGLEMVARLVRLPETRVGGARGTEAPLELRGGGARAVLGSGQEGACRVPGECVSSAHCSLELDAAGLLWLTDSSTNGTYVDGETRRLKRGKQRELRHDSTFTLTRDGPAFRVEIVSGAAEGEAMAAVSAATLTEPAVALPPPPPPSAAPAAGVAAEAVNDRAEREAYWTRRRALDSELGALCERMQSRLLGPAACLLLPPPTATPAAATAALAALRAWALAEAVAKRWRVLNAPLLVAACEAAAGDEAAAGVAREAFGAALASDKGQPLPQSAIVALSMAARKQWAHAVVEAEAAAEAAKGRTAAGTKGGGGAKGKVKAAAEAASLGEVASAVASAVAGSTAAAAAAAAAARAAVVLVLDERLASLPWECVPVLRALPVCRLPCAAFLPGCAEAADALHARGGGGAHGGDAFYVLNPSGELRRTHETFAADFARPPWRGVAGEPPERAVLEAELPARHLYVYCGHGDGGRYLGAEALQRLPRCAATMLMGCSSGALQQHGRLGPSGMALAYLHARCPALVANLWDVTDGDIDRLCKALLAHLGRGGSVLGALAAARGACRLPFLTGAAPVCYGVPLAFRPRDAPPLRASGEAKQQ